MNVSSSVRILAATAVLAFTVTIPANAGLLKKLKGGGSSENAPAPAAESAAPPAAETAAPSGGPKMIVAVGAFEGAGKLGWDEGPVMAAMLQDALMNSGRFLVVDRATLDSALKEQDLGAAGRINSQTALKIGSIVGAQYLIQGTVTQFEPGESGQSGRVGVPLPGVGSIGIGGSQVTSKIAMQLRIIDLTTTVVLSTHKAEHTGKHKSIGADVYAKGFSVGGDQFKKTPLGETAEKCIAKCVDHIIATLGKQPFRARVAAVEGKTIIINAGSNRGVSEGMTLAAMKQGKTITDPDTGLPLEVSFTKTGTVKVDSVSEKTARCSLVDGKSPAVGDALEIAQ
ncbi:MAG TPA: CsgG/HfaB family protein [Candidatus Hydrogenedentes bacterium]|nr:CsgG/HfaB family protein [Candidatus Hydrogenedentota bacterium]